MISLPSAPRSCSSAAPRRAGFGPRVAPHPGHPQQARSCPRLAPWRHQIPAPCPVRGRCGAHVLRCDWCLFFSKPGAEINCSYTMKSHFIAKALGKANVILTDIEYKSLTVSHPAFTLCSVAEEQHASRMPGVRKTRKKHAFLSPYERQL